MQDIYPSRHADVAEFLPRLDPVVHSDWSEDAPISRAQAEQFDRDGYLVLEDIFSDAEVAFLQREAGKLLAETIAGQSERFDIFSAMPHRMFPGGRWLRTPLLVLATNFYKLRDRL